MKKPPVEVSGVAGASEVSGLSPGSGAPRAGEPGGAAPRRAVAPASLPFVHLHVHSPFSFLDGASRLDELVRRAADLGQPALAITDHDNVCAAVQLVRLARGAGLAPIHGAEVTVASVRGEPGAPGAPGEPEMSGSPGSPMSPGGGPYHLTLLARGPAGYANLCRLLTRAHLERERRQPCAGVEALTACAGGLVALSGCRRGEISALIVRRRFAAAEEVARRLIAIFGRDSLFLEVTADWLPGASALNGALAELASRLGLGLVATGNVHYVAGDGLPLHDALTCVRTLTRVHEVHPERRINGENYLKSAAEVERALGGAARAPWARRAIANAAAVAEMCRPGLELGGSLYPSFSPPAGETAEGFLRRLTMDGARARYGQLTPRVRDRLGHELDIICRLGYAGYFLLVWDVVRFAKSRGIRCAGRGSAADSAVAYCLGLTEVDAIKRGLLFERFMSLERAGRPDIDIDFDARRRDEVAGYVYEKYGRDRVAAVCTYNTFLARGAIRDLGKALDLQPADVDRLARRFPYLPADRVREALTRYPELRASGVPVERYERLFDLCERAAGLPRHIGTHLGGLVIAPRPLTDFTPLQMAAKGLVVCQFDKDFVEDLGLAKLDLLSLRTLTAVDEALRLAREGGRPVDYEAIPLDDPATLRMINRGETVGVFQLESPAQRALQARLGAAGLEDVVASVALIRPGPIKGNMVEPFVRRRLGQEAVQYPDPRLEPILKKTYGVVLFQEQVIEIATAIANFSPGEADQLRRVMTHGRSQAEMAEIGKKFVERAVASGTDPAAAEGIFHCMAGYASYGFCEAHAAAFANTACKTAYLVCHRPAEFFAAIMSCQPMGYYPPAVLVVEARRRGVAVLPVDVNVSGDGYLVERAGPPARWPTGAGGRPSQPGIRVSLRQVRGMGEAALQAILAARAARPFLDIDDFCRRAAVDRDVVENLIRCGAFDPLHPNRRALLWRAAAAWEGRAASRSTGRARHAGGATGAAAGGAAAGTAGGGDPAPLLAGDPALLSPVATLIYEHDLPDFTPAEKVALETEVLGFTTGPHFMELLRPRLARAGFLASDAVRRLPRGTRVRVAGLPVRPHRPPTRSGRVIVFLSLEDERGLIDVTVFDELYQRRGAVIFADPAPPLEVRGRVERRGRGVSIVADDVAELRV
jgi:error-prone DNA polymerase